GRRPLHPAQPGDLDLEPPVERQVVVADRVLLERPLVLVPDLPQALDGDLGSREARSIRYRRPLIVTQNSASGSGSPAASKRSRTSEANTVPGGVRPQPPRQQRPVERDPGGLPAGVL